MFTIIVFNTHVNLVFKILEKKFFRIRCADFLKFAAVKLNFRSIFDSFIVELK